MTARAVWTLGQHKAGPYLDLAPHSFQFRFDLDIFCPTACRAAGARHRHACARVAAQDPLMIGNISICCLPCRHRQEAGGAGASGFSQCAGGVSPAGSFVAASPWAAASWTSERPNAVWRLAPSRCAPSRLARFKMARLRSRNRALVRSQLHPIRRLITVRTATIEVVPENWTGG